MPPPRRAPAPISSKAPPRRPRWRASSGSIAAPWRRWKARGDVADRSTRPHRLAIPDHRLGRSPDRRAAPRSCCRSTTSSRRCGAASTGTCRAAASTAASSATACPPADRATGAGRRLPNRHPGRVRPYRSQAPAAAGPPARPIACPRKLGLRSTAPPASSISRSSIAAWRHRRRLPRPLPRPFPALVHTILTDNGAEFTDRFAVARKPTRPGDPPASTRSTRLRRALHHPPPDPALPPQTNDMVERFNRRLGEHLARMPQNRAAHHRQLSQPCRTRCLPPHLRRSIYNRPALRRCLDYQAPAELLR